MKFAQVQRAAGWWFQGKAAPVLRNVLFEHTRDGARPAGGANAVLPQWNNVTLCQVETNPTGHVQADGFFSRFLLVQQSALKRKSKKKTVTLSEASPDERPSPAPKLPVHSHAPEEAAKQTPIPVSKTLEEEGGSPKLRHMHHRGQPSWSLLTQPGANQVHLTLARD